MASEHGDHDYLVMPSTRLTYAEAEHRSADIASRMLARGIGKGTRVGLMFTYSAEWVLVWL